MRKFTAFICLVLFLATSVFASKTTFYTLDNGLKVIIRPVDRAGLVAMVWYKVGSADEPNGLTGISHALEHMMFKGTNTVAPNAYSKMIASNGGQDNAMTSADFTAYFAKISTKQLPTFLTLEADRMQNLLLEKKEFLKEIKVVQEERRMRTENNPQALAYERLMAATHVASPYHHPTVGWMNDLENMRTSDLKKWYETWYSPNNATIVLVGNVQAANALSLVKQHFSAIHSNKLPERKPQRLPPSLGKRELSFQLKAKLPLLALSFNVPTVNTADKKWLPYALDVIAGVLDGGNSARFEKELVRGQHLATELDVSYDLYSRFDTAFILLGVPSKMETLLPLKKAVLKQIDRLKTQPVDKKELTRIKNQVIAGKVYEKDSLFGQAMGLGMLETVGVGYKENDNYFSHINAVTAKQVQQAAQIIFTPDRMTIATLMPETLGSKQ